MRIGILLGGMAVLAACSSSKTGTSIMCGAGTMLQGDTCVATGSGSGSGSGNDVTCGTGTHLDGNMCVPDGPAATGAPTITTMTPTSSGWSGYVLFTIDGTGFAGQDVTDLHVYFGDTTPGMNGQLGPCEAQIGQATPTEITGEVPPACDFNVTVTVTTNIGMATTPFHYDALLAADGDGGGTFGNPGDMYLIDPYAEVFADLGPMTDASMTGYGLSGIVWSADGTTLYGVTTGDSPGDPNEQSQLVTINPFTQTGPAITVVGDLVDAAGNSYFVTDIKTSGTTLYGWAVDFVNSTQGLVTIDPASGAVTPVGTPGAAAYGWNAGLVIDGTGAITVAPSGAGADTDTSFTATGELDTVDSTTGALTTAATLDYPIGAPVNAMATIGGYTMAAIDNGTYGAYNAGGNPLYGESLAIIDPTHTPIVSPYWELPAQVGAQSAVDALDAVPTLAPSTAHRLPHLHALPLAPAKPVGKR